MGLKNQALEGSWGGLLGVLGCLGQSWAVLARLGCVWVTIFVCLEAFGRSLGAILGVLGGSWERLWRVFGGSWGAWGVHLGLRRSIFERLVAILIDFTRIAKTLKKQWFFLVF